MSKGQVNIHFIISITLFILIIIYLATLIINFYPTHTGDTYSNILYARAYSISELLIKDPGYPENWDSTNFERIGLASKPYSLNLTKINEFIKICNSTDLTKIEKLRQSFGLTGSFVVEIKSFDGSTKYNCSLGGRKVLGEEAKVKRIATLENKFVEVVVYAG